MLIWVCGGTGIQANAERIKSSSLFKPNYVEEVHTVERCPHKADVAGPNPAFSNVPIVLAVSTKDCGSLGSGSNPDGHPISRCSLTGKALD